MKTAAFAGAGIVALLVSLLGVAATGGAATASGPSPRTSPSPGLASGGGGPAPSATARRDIPAAMLALYRRGATACPGLTWTVLAGIGTVESDNGRSQLPGVHGGANFAGAEGPMQFEPATFAVYAEPVPPGGARPPSPYDPADAVYAAARMLCANGGREDRDLPGAVWAYNHSSAYVAEVLTLAAAYTGAGAGRSGSPPPAPPGRTGAYPPAVIAALWALAQRGTPYVWGGETPGVGFDCSGLVQAAYRVAGVTLPRVAQQQYDAGPHLAPTAPLDPGDLVFFGGGPADVSHVGIYVATSGGRAWMVDAPHTGADVRVEPFPDTPGAAWGTDVYVGATDPG